MKVLKKISDISMYSIYILYGFFALLLTNYFFSDYSTANFAFVLTGFLLSCTIGTYILIKLSDIKKDGRIFLLLLLACFIVKLTWVLKFTIKPYADYETFYNMAVALSRQDIVNSRYIALFPHIMGYSLFLSAFIKLFGESFLLPPIINVFLSTLSLALLYYVCKKLVGVRAAIIAGFLWILMPSQTIYNMFALSEPLYTAELLAVLALIVFVNGKFENMALPKLILCSVFIAFMLSLFNKTRPMAAIPIIALIIWLFAVNVERISEDRILLKKAVYIFAIIIFYMVFSHYSTRYIAARLGEEPAGVPGFNIYVGLNENYAGTWNTEDSQLLWTYSTAESSADDTQKHLLDDARSRLENADFSKLLHEKFLLFLADDCAAISYAESEFEHPGALRVICNAFYFFVVTFSAFGALAAAKNRNKSPLFIICIYAVGLTMAQMAVEVAGRYHYSIIVSMIVLAAYGIDYLKGELLERNAMRRKRHLMIRKIKA